MLRGISGLPFIAGRSAWRMVAFLPLGLQYVLAQHMWTASWRDRVYPVPCSLEHRIIELDYLIRESLTWLAKPSINTDACPCQAYWWLLIPDLPINSVEGGDSVERSEPSWVETGIRPDLPCLARESPRDIPTYYPGTRDRIDRLSLTSQRREE